MATGGSGGQKPQPKSEPTPDAGPKNPSKPAPGTWIQVHAGSFTEGAQPGESCSTGALNQVAHDVTLTRDFELSATEVTYADYAIAFGTERSGHAGCDDCPVNLVSHHDAAAICNQYSKYSELSPCYACSGGKCSEALPPGACYGYRLPTEAEWEYAYRATTSSPIYNGDIQNCSGFDSNIDAIAWYLYNASGGAHPVAEKQANAWGFFDMSGNLWEWTHDGYVSDRSTLPNIDPIGKNAEGLRVMRGGSYNCIPHEIRGAHRSALPAEVSGLNVGVRCARTLVD